MSASESEVPISSVSRWAASARVKRKSSAQISTRMFSARSRLIGQVDGGPKRLLTTRLNEGGRCSMSWPRAVWIRGS